MPERKLHSALALTPKGYPPCHGKNRNLRTTTLEHVSCGGCQGGLLLAIEHGDLDADAAALRRAWRLPPAPEPLPPAASKPLRMPARRPQTVARMIAECWVEGVPDEEVAIDLGYIGGGGGWAWGEFTLSDLKRLAAAALKR